MAANPPLADSCGRKFGGAPRPSSAAFRDSDDGTPMSGFWEQLQYDSGLSEQDALRGHDGFSLAMFTAGLARELGQGIHPNPDEVSGPAHVLVFGDKPKKTVRQRLAKESVWRVPPSNN
jgi:hypothetical protein